MPRQTKRITVGGFEYEFTALPGTLTRRFEVRMLKELARGFREVEIPKGVHGEAALIAALLSTTEGFRSVSDFISGLDETLLDELDREFGKLTRVRMGENWPNLIEDGGSKVIYDEHFSCNGKQYFRWLGACLTFNYADFLDEALATIRRRSQEREALTPPTGSTGSSGDS